MRRSLGAGTVRGSHETIISVGSIIDCADACQRSNSCSRRRWRCRCWVNRRPRSRHDRRSCHRRPAILRATTASLCSSGAGLLLDARSAGVGRVSRSMDLPSCPSLQLMGRKTARQLGSLLILLGLIGGLTSVAWWHNFYSQMAGQAPVECLYQLTGSCRMVSNVAEFFGAAAYDARLFWASGIAALTGIFLQR